MLEELLQLGIEIGSDGELPSVLDRIVRQARRFTGAEAATLFIREGASLRFAVVQNEVTARRLGQHEVQQRLEIERLPLDVPSLAGHVANSGEILNVPGGLRHSARRAVPRSTGGSIWPPATGRTRCWPSRSGTPRGGSRACSS